ncbi:MAG: hypothetical protein V7724_03035 [Sediminicola sp.]
MARIGSPFIIMGTLGEIDFNVDVGGMLPRRPAANDKITGSLAMFRGKVGIHGALRPYYVGIRGGRTHYGMVGMFIQVKERDRGERTMESGPAPTDGLRILSSYTYPKAYFLYGAMGCQFRMNRAPRHCAFPNLGPAITVFPEGKTYLGLRFGIVFMDLAQIIAHFFPQGSIFFRKRQAPGR